MSLAKPRVTAYHAFNSWAKRGRTMTVLAWVISMCVAGGDEGLAGHWPLTEDCRDISGNENHAENHDVRFVDGAAAFDGRGAYLEILNADTLVFGADDFSVTAWVCTESKLDDTLGDIASKLDPATRTGFQLGLQNFSGVTSAQPNHRHLQFGMDAGTDDGSWTDCGRVGNAVFIMALCVCDGQLYAGTCEPGADESGHVYRYDGGTTWTDCGGPDASNSVYTLAVFDGELYAGTGRYRLEGSALPHSPNENPGGNVFRYRGGTDWELCGRLGDADAVHAMAVYNGDLYAIPAYHKGVYRYAGGTTWTSCGIPGDTVGPMFGESDSTIGCRLISLVVHDGYLYGAGNGRDQGIFRYEGGDDWTNVGKPGGVDQVYSFMQYGGKLYTGTWPNAEVFRYDGGDAWTSCGRLGDELEVMAMAVYNGSLYAGSLPLAQVYRYDGGTAWTSTGRLDHTPNVKYRRAWSMAVFQGKLFCGVLPSGHVHAFETGACVTYDHALTPGWRHVAAVRDGDRLKLYIDGTLVSTSSKFDPTRFDLACQQPLRIGLGAHDFFNGSIRDFRIYTRALGPEDVALLTRE